MFGKRDIEDVMYGRRSSPAVSSVLRPLSLVYALIVMLRKGLFRVGMLHRKTVGLPVISVGNLTLGGTGKTPAVLHIARILQKQGRRPAVISRGYGRENESEVLVVSDGTRLLADACTGGDEPVLIASKLAGIPVVVGSDRSRAAALARKEFGIDSVILDDGFQHLRLRRDLDIVLLDGLDPFGNGRLFPAGILREPVSALGRADVIVIGNSDRIPAGDLESLRRKVANSSRARVFSSRVQPADLVDIQNSDVRSLSALRGTRVLALSGIARPAGFLAMLKALGADVREHFVFADHHRYERDDLAALFRKAADERVSMIVTTEKDSMRLRRLKPEGIWALRIELEIMEKNEWEAFLTDRI
jgi:tetraacyldisaccharide 4'-kinase